MKQNIYEFYILLLSNRNPVSKTRRTELAVTHESTSLLTYMLIFKRKNQYPIQTFWEAKEFRLYINLNCLGLFSFALILRTSTCNIKKAKRIRSPGLQLQFYQNLDFFFPRTGEMKQASKNNTTLALVYKIVMGLKIYF